MKMKLFTGIAAGFMALSTPVWADVSAQDALGLIQNLYGSNGQSLTFGTEVMDGDTLTLTDATIAIDQPGITVKVNVGWIKLRETGGAVEITLSPATKITFSTTAEADLPVSAAATLELTDYLTKLSGSLDDLSVTSNVGGLNLTLDNVAIGPLVLDASLGISAQDISSAYVIEGMNEKWRTMEGGSTVAALGLNFDFNIPGDEGFVNGSFDAKDFDLEFFGNVPDFLDLQTRIDSGENPLEIMQELTELSLAYRLGMGALNYGFTMDVDGNKAAVNGSQQSSASGLDLSTDLIGYGFSYQDGEINVASSEIPFPQVQLKYEEIALDFEVPLIKTETPEDTSVFVALRGIEINDFIWSIFDPKGTLPRDPATAVLDMSGKVNVLFDMEDLQQSIGMVMIGNRPAEPISLNLNELLISAAGATLEGVGAFTFNNDDLETFDGVPQPIGSVDLSLRGGFGLLEKLMALGFVPEEAAFGLRAMLGAFAKPGDEADHFTSTIELTPEGAVLANGARIK